MSILNWLRRGVSRTASRQRAGRRNVRRLHVEWLEERCVLTPVVSVLPIAPQEGTQFSGPVATFTDATTGPARYTALINWGDGSAVQTVTPTGHTNGVFTVNGSHTYTEEKGYTITVNVTNTTPPDSWTAVASMATGRTSLAAASGSDGRIYALGGQDSIGNAVSTVEAYNLVTNTWTTVASMPTARTGLAAVSGPNGLIYAIGGFNNINLSTVEAYNPATNTWSTEASMLTARAHLAAALGANGLIYVFGGNSDNGIINTVEAYNPVTNTWTTEAPMPTARNYLAAAPGPNGLIYAIGGLENTTNAPVSTVEAYNPATNSWTTEASLPTARAELAAATGSDGLIYAIGGGEDTPPSGFSIVEAYNPATNSWATKTSLPSGRANGAAALGADDRIYVTGGDDANNTALTTVDALNTNTGSGSTPITVLDQAPVVSALPISPVEGALFSGAVATFTDPGGNEAAANYAATINWGDGSGTDTIAPSVSLVNGQLTVSGRHTYTEEAGYTITVTVTDDGGVAGVNSWTTKASMPTARLSLAAAAGPNGLLYTFGGENSPTGFSDLATVEGYNPATNTWTTEASMPSARTALAAAPGPNGLIYTFGGFHNSINQSPYLNTVEAYSPVTNSWTTEANLPTARAELAAVLGPNGLIYVFGGENGNSFGLSTVEAYNPVTNTWATEANMPTARTGLTAALGPAGQIYVFGGANNPSGILNTVEAYNPATNTWTTVASMPTARTDLAAALGTDGLLYVFGGVELFGNSFATVEAYNPATNTWTTTPSMPTARGYLAAVSGADGLLYTFGGLDNTSTAVVTAEAYRPAGLSNTRSTPITVIDQAPVVSVLPIAPQEGALFSGPVATVTDPGGNEAAANYSATINWGDGSGSDTITPSISLVNGQLTVSGRHTYTAEGGYTITVTVTDDGGVSGVNTWTAKANMPTPNQGSAAAPGSNGLIYTFGGFNNSGPNATVQAYNPATNTWTTKTSMPTARELLAAAPGPNGLIYTFGGFNNVNGELNTVEAYNPATDTWTTKANMPTAREFLAAVLAANGLIYTFGGLIPGSVVNTVEAYNPATNTWTTEAPMPTAREGLAAVSGPNGLIYVFGGDNFSGVLSTVEAYNPATNTWVTEASMPTARQGLAAALGTDGLIYAFGGFTSPFGILSTVEAYNPATNTWTTKASLPTARTELSAAAGADGQLYAIGGSDGHNAFSTVEAYLPSGLSNTNSTLIGASDPPVQVTAAQGPFIATEGTPSAVQTLATFTDPGGPGETEYTAVINWGDNTASDTATLADGGLVDLGTVNGAESFAVKGQHTYIKSGSLTLSVSIQHAALAPVVVNDVANVANVSVPPPSSLSLDPGSDSGPPNITNVRTPTFNGTAPAGTTVTLFSDGVAVGSGRVTGGAFHITTTPLADGVHQITAQATDANGNVSPLSGALTVTIDATPPTSTITFPTATAFSTTTWTGAVTGTATDNLSGVAAVQVSVFDSTANTYFDGTGFVASSTPLFVAATGTTSWSLPLPASALTVGDSYSVSSQAKDVAGNVQTPLAAIAFTFSSGTPPAKSPTQDKMAAFSPDGTWALDLGGNGTNVVTVVFGLPGDWPITGDWNGAGFDEIGTVRVDPNAFAPDGNHALRWSFDTNGNNQWDSGDGSFIFGEEGDQIVLGDWNGDGKTKVGVVRADANGVLVWSLDYSGSYATTGQYTIYHYGLNGDQVVSGDWTGDGTDKIGVTRANLSVTLADGSHPMLWALNYPGNGVYNGSFFTFGASYDALLTGDWTGDGKTKVGVAAADPNGVGADIALDLDSNGINNPSTSNFVYGLVGDVFIRGDWNVGGKDKIGVVRSSGPATLSVTLDGNGSHGFGAVFSLPGLGSDTILVGSWKP